MGQSIKQGIAELCPKGFDSPLALVAKLVCQTKVQKGREQSRNTQARNEFARREIPFGQFVQTQLDFPHFWCSLFGKFNVK